MRSLVLVLALAAAPLQILAEEANVFRGPITERWIAASTRGPLQLARLRTPEGSSFKVVVTARPGELDGRPVLVVQVITEQIPAR